jgi:hypothetical protein
MANNLLSLQMINPEAMRAVANSNVFLRHYEWVDEPLPVSMLPHNPKLLVAAAAGAVLLKNPQVSRRGLFGWLK